MVAGFRSLQPGFGFIDHGLNPRQIRLCTGPSLQPLRSVLARGESMGMYHREKAQEGFLVVAGECLLIVEEQERRLRQWDFFHCPGGTEHIIVGAGDEPAILVAVGARGRGVGGGVVYTVSELAARHGASVERETTKPGEAYAQIFADLPRSHFVPYEPGWLPD